MADFSPSGIPDLPGMTIESLEKGGDPRVLGWLSEAVIEGDRLNQADPFYDRMEAGMNYVIGIQARTGQGGSAPPAYLPSFKFNKSRTTVQAHVSALTDMKMFSAYKATNPAFAVQADLLGKLNVAWWLTSFADIEVGNVIKYALAAGMGDLTTEWDPHCNFYGDVRINARDSRDTLPIRPPLHSKSIHDWEGVVIRESHTINALRALYPNQANLFAPTTDSLLSTLMGRVKRIWNRFSSPAADTLSRLNAPPMASRVRSGEVLLYRTYLTDRTKNLTSKPIPMGPPGTAWAYVVPPGGHLYPFKRLIVSTPEMILFDGPSPYWHGTFPISRLKLWDVPWVWGGLSLLNDLMPVQDGINDMGRDLLLGFKQWMDRIPVYDRSAVSETLMRTFDPRRTGSAQKVKLNSTGAKEGFKLLDGVPPQVLAMGLQMMQLLMQQFDDLSGTPNMQELLALRQLPAADTLQRYYESLTPEIRQEGRQVEAFLRDVGDQIKVLRFQYESNARRIAILGQAGETLEDFDFDPATMVPSLAQGEPGYHPALDKSKSRMERTQAFSKMIVFTVAPNSILNINATEKKMMNLQLSRMGMLDMWSMAESLEIPNYGVPPKIPLPPINEEKAAAEIQELTQLIALAPDPQTKAQALAALQAKYLMDPASGRWLEIREPVTVTERLMAQNLLGIGMTENPAGRKASGQAPPQQETKSDGRTTITESRHEPGPNS